MRLVLLLAALPLLTGQEPFELRDGERVAFIGDTFAEREQLDGHIESLFLRRFPGRAVTWRNLGWSADLPSGRSRAGFKPESGFERLKEHVAAVRPTLVIAAYGMAASLDGEAGLPGFVKDTAALLDALKGEGVRFLLLGPIRHAHTGRTTDALRSLARDRSLPFVALSDLPDPLTDNGIHLTDAGYRQAAEAIAKALGWPPDFARLEMDRLLKAKDSFLPSERLVTARGLKGRTSLTVDGVTAATASPEEWEKGVRIKAAEEVELRRRLAKKNELYFHRYRPQNETYLLGFRKHEQGRNARELPMFDALIAKEEAEIARLLKPVEHAYELVPAEKAPKTDARRPEPERPVLTLLGPPAFEVAEGYQVNLFAEAPQIAKPIQMNFDPQGRLWVVSSSVYPQIEPGQEANDKVIVLEDTDFDGRADRSTVFADGLLIPTGIAPGDSGCYVAQSTELLHLADSDGDGRADRRRVVLSGFGTEDTHHLVHTLRWGPDGRLFFNQSIYIHSHLETPHGVVRLDSGGIFALRPSTGKLEVFARGFYNSWGHHADAFGRSFITDGAGFAGMHYGFPGATFEAYAGARRLLGSISAGRWPKFCGLEIVSGRHLPEDMQGVAVTNDFRASRVARFAIAEDGAGFSARPLPDLLRSKDNWFRPVDVKMGPDGAIYVADWSNSIINHGEVDFRDPRRDHTSGRIWRITASGRPLAPRPRLNTLAEALENLKSPEGYAREQARRVLAERGAKVAAEGLEALWVGQATGNVDTDLLAGLLRPGDGRLRAAAVRVVSDWRPPNAFDLLVERAADSHPHVRLETVRALGRFPSARAAATALSVLDFPMDRFLDHALWLTMNELAEPWVDAVVSGEWKAEGRRAQLDFALKSIPPAIALKAARLFPGIGPEVVLRTGGPRELRALFDQVVAGRFDAEGRVRVLAGLAEAARLRGAVPSGELDGLGPLLGHEDPAVRREAMRLAGRWRLWQFHPELLKLAAESPAVRAAAFEGLREMRGKGVTDGLAELCARGRPFEVREGAVRTLAALKPEEASRGFEILAEAPDDEAALALWRGLLSIRGTAGPIAAALPKSGLSKRIATAGLRAVGETGRPEPELVLALARGSGLAEERELTEAEIKDLAARALKEGDPARGERVYRRRDLGCTACHAVAGAGGRVGPDLGSIGASAPADYLVESLLHPGRKIKEGFHAAIVQTRDGQVLSGVVLREGDEELVLRNAEGREVSIPKRTIEARKPGGSLMPSNVSHGLDRGELLDLARFLSELGRPGAYDTARLPVARLWKAKSGAPPADWKEADQRIVLSWVDGRVSREDLGDGVVHLSTRVQAAATQRVRLALATPPGAELRIDGRPVALEAIELAAGPHTLTLRFDAALASDGVRLESRDVVFLTEP